MVTGPKHNHSHQNTATLCAEVPDLLTLLTSLNIHRQRETTWSPAGDVMCTTCTRQLVSSCLSAGIHPKEPMDSVCDQLTWRPAGYGSWVPGTRRHGG